MKIKYVMAFLLAAGTASAQDVSGLWQTEAGDEGGFLHVQMAPCGDMMCGTINRAFGNDRKPVEGYEHAGKKMIWDMKADGDGAWKGGKIWAPDRDKTYGSKMELTANGLKVSGCVAGLICRSQLWRKVQ